MLELFQISLRFDDKINILSIYGIIGWAVMRLSNEILL